MTDFTVAEWFRTLPRRGDGPAGRPAKGSPQAGGPSPATATTPVSAGDSAGDLVPRELIDADTVEISPQGRRLQIEAQVRNAVLAELRLMAQAASSLAETGPPGNEKLTNDNGQRATEDPH